MLYEVSYISGRDLKLHSRTIEASDENDAVEKAFALEGNNFENTFVSVCKRKSAKYRVWKKKTTYSYIEIEADSEREAEENAENTDDEEFTETEGDNDEFEIIKVECIDQVS